MDHSSTSFPVSPAVGNVPRSVSIIKSFRLAHSVGHLAAAWMWLLPLSDMALIPSQDTSLHILYIYANTADSSFKWDHLAEKIQDDETVHVEASKTILQNKSMSLVFCFWFCFALFVYFCKEISQGLLYTRDPPSVASWVMAGLLCLVQYILFLQNFQPHGPGNFFSAVEDLASGSTNSLSSSVPPPPSAVNPPLSQTDTFYYVYVPLTFLSLESITSPWGIFPPEGKPFFCLVIWIYVCLNGVSCSSDSPQIYYVGEDDRELPILCPFPPVTAGIAGILYHSQPTTAFSINLFLLLTVLA